MTWDIYPRTTCDKMISAERVKIGSKVTLNFGYISSSNHLSITVWRYNLLGAPLKQEEMLRSWKDGSKGSGHYPVLLYPPIILGQVSLRTSAGS